MHDTRLPALFDLRDQVCLVTGAATGIGQALAVGLAQAGARLAITVNASPADETLAAVAALGCECQVIQADLCAPQSAHQVRDEVLARFGRLDVLVNNAGIIRRAAAVDTLEQDWSAVLEANLNAAWRLCQAVAPQMLAQGRGKIVNIASLLSFQGGVRVPAYTASKHALLGLTRALANEWAAQGVGVNAIAPGYIETANTAALRADPLRQRQILERIPAGRWGRPEDLVGAAVFLASRASDYMHGQVLVVDGGWMAR